MVLNSIANKINLPEILGEHANEILSLVYAHCLNYKSVNNMPEWFERTDLNSILDLDGLTEYSLLTALDDFNEDRVEEVQRNIFNSVKKTYNLSSRGIVYDVTNTYLYGTKCQLAKLGHSKEGRKDKPLIQIGLAATQKEGIPIFHKTFDGNIHDSKTLHSLVQMFSGYKLNSGLFVYDRGIFSKENIKDIHDLGWSTLCGISMNNALKDIIRDILEDELINEVSNMISLSKKNVFYIKSINHSFNGVKGKLAICYNDRKRTEIKEFRHCEISNAYNLLSKGKPIKPGLERYFTASGRIKKGEVESAEEFDGYFCLFSTKKMSNKDMIRLYFDKDVIEKSFRTLKGITNLRPVRHWLYDRVIAHVFICYLSYLLLSILKLNLRNNDLDISSEKALKELESMYRVYLYDKKGKNNFKRTVILSKQQKIILKSVDKSLIRKCGV